MSGDPPGGLHVEELGSGPRVVFLHGDVETASTGWRRQLPLAERWRLVLPDRPGCGASAPGRVDFAADARRLVPLLDGGAHLVGHSYGGVIALEMATLAPGQVRSLTVIEPPAFGLSSSPAAADLRAKFEAVFASDVDDAAFFREFAELLGERPWPRPTLPAPMLAGVKALRAERPPWEADPDLETIRAAGIPTLVVSSGGRPALEAVCDAIAARTTGRRAVFRGARHGVAGSADGFNPVVEEFWREAGAARRADPA